jgi:phage baseplate assembly protein W
MTRGYSPKLPLSLSPDGGYALNQNVTDVVKQNFKTLLLTSPGERIFSASFGVGLKRFLFEPRTEETFIQIKNRIYSQTNEYLPFIDIMDIQIVPDLEQENLIYVTIQYFIKNISFYDLIKLTVSP